MAEDNIQNREEALQLELEIALAQHKRLQNMKKILKVQDESIERNEKLSRLNSMLSDSYKRQNKLKKDVNSLQEEENALILKERDTTGDIAGETFVIKKNKQETNSVVETGLGLENEILNAHEKQGEQLSSNTNLANKFSEQITGSISGLKSQIESLPSGGILSGALGLDDFQEQFSSSFGEALQTGDIKTFSSNVGGMFSNIKSSLTSTLGLIGIFIASIGIIFAIFKGIHDQMQSISTELGTSSVVARELVDRSYDWTGNMSTGLSTQKDILESQKEIVNEFGTFLDINKENVDTITTLNKTFGISNSVAASVSKTLQQIGASASEANKISIFTANLAEAAGVPIGPVMQDISQNAEFANLHFSSMPKQLAAAAVEANRLGLSLSDVSQMTEGVLDIQGSLEKEMQAQVLLGKQINFDEARRLTLMNKPVEAAKSMLEQLGGITEFNEMDLFQKQAISEATGMSVDKLGEHLRRQKLIGKMDADQTAELNKANDQLENMNELTKEQILKEKTSQAALSKLSASWSQIKTSLSQIIIPLGDLMLPILNSIASAVTYISEATGKRWAGGLAIISIGFLPSILKKFGILSGLVSSVGSKMKKMIPGLGKLQEKLSTPKGGGKGVGMFSKLNNAVSKVDPKKLLAVGGAMALVAGSVWILSKAMQNFSEGVTWEGVLMGITSLFALTGAVAALGALMMSGVGAVAIIAGAAAMGIIAGAIWVLSKALENFTEYSGALVSFFKDIGEVDGKALFAVAGGIGALSAAMVAFASSSVMSAIGGAFTSIFGGGIVGQLETLAVMADDLNLVANSLSLINDALISLSQIDISKIVGGLNSIDTDLVVNVVGGAGVASSAASPIKTNSGQSESGVQDNVLQSQVTNNNINNNQNISQQSTGGSDTEIILLLKKLIEKVDSPVNIKIGNKVITELTKQQSMKKNMNFGFD